MEAKHLLKRHRKCHYSSQWYGKHSIWHQYPSFSIIFYIPPPPPPAKNRKFKIQAPRFTATCADPASLKIWRVYVQRSLIWHQYRLSQYFSCLAPHPPNTGNSKFDSQGKHLHVPTHLPWKFGDSTSSSLNLTPILIIFTIFSPIQCLAPPPATPQNRKFQIRAPSCSSTCGPSPSLKM